MSRQCVIPYLTLDGMLTACRQCAKLTKQLLTISFKLMIVCQHIQVVARILQAGAL